LRPAACFWARLPPLPSPLLLALWLLPWPEPEPPAPLRPGTGTGTGTGQDDDDDGPEQFPTGASHSIWDAWPFREEPETAEGGVLPADDDPFPGFGHPPEPGGPTDSV